MNNWKVIVILEENNTMINKIPELVNEVTKLLKKINNWFNISLILLSFSITNIVFFIVYHQHFNNTIISKKEK